MADGDPSGAAWQGTVRWLFGDQLGPHFLDDPDQPVLLVEARSVFRRRRFHRQKAHLVLSAMRHRAAELGERCTYVRAETYGEVLAGLDAPVEVVQPTSYTADRFVRHRPEVARVLPERGFATSRADFTRWADGRGRRRLLLENFYRDARTRLDVLMDGAEPAGGRWNLDADNREPPPKGARTLGVEAPRWPAEDAIDAQVRADLDGWERHDGIRFLGDDGRAGSLRRARRPGVGSPTSSRTASPPSARTRTRCSPATTGWPIRCCRPR